MDSKDYFEKFYQQTKNHTYSKSLYTFFEENIRHRLPPNELEILELGSGPYSLFEDILHLNAHVTAIDFSKTAFLKTKKSRVLYKEANIIDSSFFKEAQFDLIFDSHCLNCLTKENEREIAFKNIYGSLKTNGLFASELMIQPEHDHVAMPFKMIKSSFDIEQELISHKFKIIFFIISRDSGFISEIDGNKIKCDWLKVVAQK